MLSIAIITVLSYLVGSIPTAIIVARKVRGIDIRQHGSGNVGATNAFRVLGKGLGTLVLLIDILKGIITTALVADGFGLTEVDQRIILGIVTVIGHNWTIFLRFKGGKGIATSLGVLLGLMVRIKGLRLAVGLTLSTWIVTFLVTGIVSLASLVAAMALPILMVVTRQHLELVILGVVLCVFVIYRHRPNLKRLMDGTESRVSLSYRRKSV